MNLVLRMVLIACCCCLLSIAVAAQELFSEQAVISKDATAELYNVELTLQPGAGSANDAGVQVALEWENAQACTQVTIARSRISFSAMSDGNVTTSKAVDVALESGRTRASHHHAPGRVAGPAAQRCVPLRQ